VTGWRHGAAGSIREDRRVDCWLAIEGDHVQSARFEVFAGPDALRGALWAARWLSGRPVADLESLTGLDNRSSGRACRRGEDRCTVH